MTSPLMGFDEFMQEALAQAQQSLRSDKGGPFGAVIVKAREIIAKGGNEVTSTNDPTAHAEIVAIRQACAILQTFQLQGCELYTSCEPCPMCLGAIYWSKLDRIYYASSKEDAAQAGFSDQFIYSELNLPMNQRQLPMLQLMRAEALKVFQEWENKSDRIDY